MAEMKNGLENRVEKSVESGVCETRHEERRWQAPREADSNMQLSAVQYASEG